MRQYLDLVKEVLSTGKYQTNRTGINTISKFSSRMEFDLMEGFPLVTTKYVSYKTIVKELLWFLRGETNIKTLDCSIWDEWAAEDGSLGPIYGAQWRNFNGVDQISYLLEGLEEGNRRLICSAWNPADLDKMALPPCHLLFQLYVADGEISMQLYQRSADLFLGVPYNIASYSTLLHIFARYSGLTPRKFVWVGGDCHIYINHLEQIHEQINRTPLALPELQIRAPFDLKPWEYKVEDFELVGYKYWPKLEGEVAV